DKRRFVLFWAILLLALPFVLPIVSLVRSSRTRADLRMLEQIVAKQEEVIGKLAQQLGELRRATPTPGRAAEQRAAPAVATPTVPQPAPRMDAAPEPPPVPPPPVVPAPAAQAAKIRAPQPTPDKPRPEPIVEPVAAPTAPRSGGGAPPERPPLTVQSFDWESLIGVKLFSAIAGIAL